MTRVFTSNHSLIWFMAVFIAHYKLSPFFPVNKLLKYSANETVWEVSAFKGKSFIHCKNKEVQK
jgi:hypothetical protein